MTPLSEHFTLEELTVSQYAARHGFSNDPPPDVVERLRVTAARMDDIRARLGGKPIIVSSGYRSTRVNAAVGGVSFPPSAHTLGWAVDFICPGFGTPFQVATRLAKLADDAGLRFDQLIHEYGNWTHISFDPRMRGERLTIYDAAIGYQHGIVAAVDYYKVRRA